MPGTIEFYFGCVSPWSYLAVEALHDMAQRFDRPVAYRPIDIARIWQTTGAGRPMNQRPRALLDYRLVDLPRWAKFRGVPLNLHPKHFPTAYGPSSAIIVAARQAGADVYPLTRALMRGCWVDEVDIGDPATCAAIADAVGLDGAALTASCDSTEVGDEIAANTDTAMAAGAWSVPSIVVDGELFFGQDRLELIAWRLAGN